MRREGAVCGKADAIYVRTGKINTVAVYKVDRLTRSLADFAKLVDLFGQHGVSIRLLAPLAFVSPRIVAMVAPAYAAARSQLAKSIGLGQSRRKKVAASSAPPSKSEKGGKRTRPAAKGSRK
jgi:DNA invertase Pin-like site-specific DNA recombinase